jgi:hypothetical protein
LRVDQKADQCAARRCSRVGASRLGGDAQRRFDGAQLRLSKTVGSDVGAGRQRRQRQDVGDDTPLEVEGARSGNIVEHEARIGRQARLDPRRLGEAELVIGGLKVAIVQQRDLHRGIRGQRPPQQALEPGARFRGRRRRAQRRHVLVEL